MEKTCTYRGNREEMLIAYLYDAAESGDRAAFETHLAGCLACRHELTELGSVRTQLATWAPPEPSSGWLSDRAAYAPPAAARTSWASSLREMPALAQLAAALLVLGVSAGVANLHVTYDDHGLSVRTGWMAPPPATEAVARPQSGTLSVATPVDPAPWRAELASLEQQLRAELKPTVVRQPVVRERDTDAA